MTLRPLQRIIEAIPTSDGAGVKLRRSLGSSTYARLDPFLMLDEFSSDNPDDYIAGFPSHPHRGFETVTYLLEGHMLHEDHLGNRGDLKTGAVQWMTAGRGIIHSEMPQQQHGRLRGFQLWINLPAKEKMKPAGYRDIDPGEIPSVSLPMGGSAKVVAGTLETADAVVEGPMQGLTTDPLYADITLGADAAFEQRIGAERNVFIYLFEGSAQVGDKDLPAHHGGILGSGDQFSIVAGPSGARFLLLAARPLNEPVVQYGPFVMNTREEIEQAVRDYQSGKLTA